MILSELVLLDDGVLEAVAAVEDASVGPERRQAAERRHQQTLHLDVSAALESLQRRAVAAVLREVDDQHAAVLVLVTCSSINTRGRYDLELFINYWSLLGGKGVSYQNLVGRFSQALTTSL